MAAESALVQRSSKGDEANAAGKTAGRNRMQEYHVHEQYLHRGICDRLRIEPMARSKESVGVPDLDWKLRLGFLVHDVSRLRRKAIDRVLKPLGVTRSQWWVLAFLSRRDGMPQVNLAAEL